MRSALAALLAAWLLASAAAAEVRRLEVVGAVPAGADAPKGVPIRQAALEAALAEAAERVARDLVARRTPERLSGAGAGSLLETASPADFAVRYQVLEDRGERRALLITDPQVATEYLLLAEVHVDVDRVRARLRQRGLLDEAPGRVGGAFHVVLEDLSSWPAYDRLRRHLLAGPARQVVPERFEAGRAVLFVEAPGGPRRLLDRLRRDPPRGLEVVALSESPEELVLRVRESFDGAPD